MTDGEALYRAILENPLDPLRRLIYADWCEENGHRQRADELRRPGDSCSAPQGVTSLFFDFVRSDTRNLLVITDFSLATWKGGLLEELAMTAHEFSRKDVAKDLFQHFPIQRIRIRDRDPLLMPGFIPGHAWQLGNSGHEYEIEPWLFAFIDYQSAAYSGTTLDGVYLVRFRSHAEAMTALSNACVDFGRKAAGLPAIRRR